MSFWIIFWSILIFTSVAWYGFLLFYVGIKGGKEIVSLTRRLTKRQADAPMDGEKE